MATSAALRQINQARVLNTLRRGSWSRVALAEFLDLNRSTVTVIISSLLELGLVRELDEQHSSGATGRPRVGVALRGDGAHFGGVELGNDQLTAVVTDLTGSEIGRAAEPTRADGGPAFAEARLCELLAEVVGDRPLTGIGMTIPGVVRANGLLEWAPTLGWRDVQLGETVRDHFGVPVYVENDANAAAMAEEQLRDAAEGANLLYLLLDSGVGTGVLVNRELYRGKKGRVGESGHIRLPVVAGLSSKDTVEQVIGRPAVLHEFRSVGRPGADWADLMAALDRGEPAAEQIRDRWQTTLGWLTGTLAWTLDPDVVVFGGPCSTLLHDDTTALQQSLIDHGPEGLPSAWRLSSLGPDNPAGGAVTLSQRAFFAVPPLLRPARALAS